MTKKTLVDFDEYDGTLKERLARGPSEEWNEAFNQLRSVTDERFDPTDPEHRKAAKDFQDSWPFFDHGYVPDISEALNWASSFFEDAENPDMFDLMQIGLQTLYANPNLIPDIETRQEFSSFTDEEWLNPENAAKLVPIALRIGAIESAEFNDSIVTAASEVGPESEKWYAANICVSHSQVRDCVRTRIDWEQRPVEEDHYRGDKKAIEHEVHLNVQRGFRIGYLYCDHWWKFNHEAAAIRAYEFAETLRENSQKGADATRQKADLAKRMFFKLSLENISAWLGASERNQITKLREIVQKSDKNDATEVFMRNGKLLSRKWFENCLSELRESGEIERYLKGKEMTRY